MGEGEQIKVERGSSRQEGGEGFINKKENGSECVYGTGKAKHMRVDYKQTSGFLSKKKRAIETYRDWGKGRGKEGKTHFRAKI